MMLMPQHLSVSSLFTGNESSSVPELKNAKDVAIDSLLCGVFSIIKNEDENDSSKG